MNIGPQERRGMKSRGRRFLLRIGLGALGGLVYFAGNAWLDHWIFRGGAGQVPTYSMLHNVVDLLLPVSVGLSLGIVLHRLELRSAAATSERARADRLGAHVRRVERDQAIWVIAASLLHEVRTPLHALGLLLDEIVTLPPASEGARADLLRRARGQVDKLVRDTGALRSLPILQPPELPRINLGEVVKGFAAQAWARTPSVALEVRAASEVWAVANPSYIEIILEHLVNNSLDALGERGGPGAISVEVGLEGDRALLRVQDDGPGIDAEAADTLFEPLRSTKPEGLGIGLSIARALARAMHGNLRLESAKPATFLLELGTREAQS